MAGDADALTGFALFADGLADAFQFASHLLVRRDNLIEVVSDFSGEAGPGAGQADAEVTVLHTLQAHQNYGKIVGHRGINAVASQMFLGVFRFGTGLGRCRHGRLLLMDGAEIHPGKAAGKAHTRALCLKRALGGCRPADKGLPQKAV